MNDFAAARTHMVDCQIHPSGVDTPAILQAFETVPREAFVPESFRSVSYRDEDLVFPDGRFLLDPMLHARMIEALEPSPSDIILDIGCLTGYSSAILSSLVSTVVAIEENGDYLKRAVETLQSLTICNVAGYKAKLNKGYPKNAPYDLIFVNGSVSNPPVPLIKQLREGGRLVCVVKPPGQSTGSAALFQSLGNNDFSSYTLFEASCPYLPGFEPEPAFTF